MPALPTLGTGVFRSVAIANEAVSFGTAGAGPGLLLRRVQADLNLDVTPLPSPEILPSQQVRDVRNGPRRVRGNFSSILVPGAHSLFWDTLMRGTWTAGATKASITDAVGTISGDNLVITSATSAAWLVSLFKRGDIVRISGFTGAFTGMNGQNMRVVATPTATVLTLVPISPNTTITAWALAAAGTTSLTVSVVGKKLFTPAASQVKKSFTLEGWHADVDVSHLYTGIRTQQLAVSFPAAGLIQFQAGLLGQDMTKSGSRQYASPTAVSTALGLTTVAGRIQYGGLQLGYITSMNVQIAANLGSDFVAGSPVVPDILQGTLSARGSMSVMMADDSMTSDFLNETDVDIAAIGTTNALGSADFMSLFMSKVRLLTPTMSDGDMGLIRTYNFQATEQTSAVGLDATTIVIQDSLA